MNILPVGALGLTPSSPPHHHTKFTAGSGLKQKQNKKYLSWDTWREIFGSKYYG